MGKLFHKDVKTVSGKVIVEDTLLMHIYKLRFVDEDGREKSILVNNDHINNLIEALRELQKHNQEVNN